LQVAKPAIESRMQRYASSETAFALLTIRPKRVTLIEQEIANLLERLAELGVAEEDQDIKEVTDEIKSRLAELRGRLDYELAVVDKQRQENIRRRHNYFPFIMTLLKALSERHLLQPMVERAVARQAGQTQSKKQKLDF
jgi:ubiquitin carboxyl-terminal hydrolase L5